MKHLGHIIIASLTLVITACRGGLSANETAGSSGTRAPSSVFMQTASAADGMLPLLRFNTPMGHFSFPQYADQAYAQKRGDYEGGLVMVATQGGPGLHPIWMCTFWFGNESRYFTSTDPNCEGKEFMSVTPYYLSDSATPSMSRVLYRCLQPISLDHLDTTDPNECRAAGYIVEGGLGYGG